MGYRSVVHSIIYGEPELLTTLITKEKLAGSEGIFESFRLDEHDGLSIHNTSVGQYVKEPDKQETRRVEVKVKLLSLYGSDWKWYDDFESVKRWEALLIEADKMGLDWEFVRIGEEDDDVEVRTSDNAEYFLRVIKSIDAGY